MALIESLQRQNDDLQRQVEDLQRVMSDNVSFMDSLRSRFQASAEVSEPEREEPNTQNQTTSPDIVMPAPISSSKVLRNGVYEVISELKGEFSAPSVFAAVKSNNPGFEFSRTGIYAIFDKLESTGIIEIVRPKDGSAPALYKKVAKNGAH